MNDQDFTPDAEDVEAHGAKELLSVGLAAAALLGAGQAARATAATAATGTQSEYVLSETDFKAADRDLDGLLSYEELEAVGFKYDVEELNAGGDEVTVEWLAQNYRLSLASIGGDGFVAKVDAIGLRRGVDPYLDAILDGKTVDWPSKYSALDLDGDSYATYEELSLAGHKWNADDLVAAGYDVSAESLDAAGYKVALDLLGDGGFAVELDAVMLKPGIDPKLDTILKGEKVDWPSKYSG